MDKAAKHFAVMLISVFIGRSIVAEYAKDPHLVVAIDYDIYFVHSVSPVDDSDPVFSGLVVELAGPTEAQRLQCFLIASVTNKLLLCGDAVHQCVAI